MKILHYALGFPPYRSGGLTKFCMDLMVQQAKEGHEVAMLWPGEIKIISKKVNIKRHKSVNLENQNLHSFELINPLPVSFDEGIADISAFMLDIGSEVYEKLFEMFQPDVIHVHTLMGIHKSFLLVAKAKRIRVIFTAHDFFPICPKVTIFRQGANCDTMKNCARCGVCNATALSLKKIQILQSPLYRELKNSYVVRKLRKQHRDNYLSESNKENFAAPVGTAEDYKSLREYYYSLLKLMDMIHYNSSVTKNIYESVFDLPENCIVHITHSNIRDNRIVKRFSDEKLRIRYLGPQSEAKGFYLLRKALDELWGERQNFCLDVHFTPVKESPYMKIHARYNYLDLKKIFDNTDILVAPSLLYETFGFTVLEALSYGVPVIISGTVGAKDILAKGVGVIIENINSEKLCEVLESITLEELKKMNKSIIEDQSIVQIEDMSERIEKLCYNWKI